MLGLLLLSGCAQSQRLDIEGLWWVVDIILVTGVGGVDICSLTAVAIADVPEERMGNKVVIHHGHDVSIILHVQDGWLMRWGLEGVVKWWVWVDVHVHGGVAHGGVGHR